MERLILTHHWGGEPCSGVTHIAFEYDSKDKFVFDMLEKYKNHEWDYYGDGRSDYETSTVTIFDGVYYTKGELEEIENSVLTLDEWFKRNKEEIT